MSECNTGGERARLDALYRYKVLDTPPEEPFDRITRLAKSVLQMPIVLVSLVDQDRQWFKSRQGYEPTETPRAISFCTHAIQQTEPMIVPDARTDPRFADSPLVSGEPFVRYYIGVPLRTRDGFNVGTLCCMDPAGRELSAQQVDMLKDLGRLVVDELELRLLATTDSLTGAMSRGAFSEEADRDIARAKRHDRPLSCALIDADHFKSINDTHGHGVGDQMLQRIVAACQSALRAGDYIGRLGGEEFAVILPETPIDAAVAVAERLRKRVEAIGDDVPSGRVAISVSIGVATLTRGEDDLGALLKKADLALYDAKALGRNRTAYHRPADGEQRPA
jgi:diguanylate cyclase (GGDEF)-like protein